MMTEQEEVSEEPSCRFNRSLNRRVGLAKKALDSALPEDPERSQIVVERLLNQPKFKPLINKLVTKLSQRRGGRRKNTHKSWITVNNFWEKSDCIRVSPEKNETIQLSNGTYAPKRFLVMSLREAWALYTEQNPEHPCSLSYFASRRPFTVELLGQASHKTCLCIHCNNFEFAYKKLQKVHPTLPKYCSKILENFVCNNSSNMCWNNTCPDCKDSKLFYQALGPVDRTKSKEVPVEKWGPKICFNPAGKPYTRTFLQTETIPDLVKHVAKLTVEQLTHQYARAHQNAAYVNINEGVTSPEASTCTCCPSSDEKCWYHTLLIQVDFSENYKLTYQDEVQSAHFNTPGISLFTVSLAFQGKITSECIVSPFTNHTIGEIMPYMTHLFDKYITDDVQEVQIFSDGARQQFKSSACMRTVEWLAQTFKVDVHWNYFASYHGKGRVDGIGATLKMSVWLRVLNGLYVCQSVADFCKAAKNHCPNVRVTAFTEAIHNRLEEKYKCSKWLQSKRIDVVVQHCTSFHHVWVLYNVDSDKIIPLKCAQVTVLPGVQLPFMGHEMDDSDVEFDDDDEEEEAAENIHTTGPAGDLGDVEGLGDVEEPLSEPEKKKRKTTTGAHIPTTPGRSSRASRHFTTSTPNASQSSFASLQQSPILSSQASASHVYDPSVQGQDNIVIPDYRCPTRAEYFKNLHDCLKKLSSWEELNDFLLTEEYEDFCGKYSLVLPKTFTMQEADIVDTFSEDLLNDDNLIPLCVPPFGDCLVASISKVMSGDPSLLITELRCRIVLDMVKNHLLYAAQTSHPEDILSKGTNLTDKQVAEKYAQLSDGYSNDPALVGKGLSEPDVLKFFKKEVMSIIPSGRFMGGWQLHSIATILKTPVKSVYILDDHTHTCALFNRIIYPLVVKGSPDDTCAVTIMWTNSQDEDNHTSRHFCPL